MRISIILIFIFVSFSSCRKLTNNDFPIFPSKPTINCILIDNQPIRVQISSTKSLDSIPLPYLNNANIDLFVNDHFTESLTNTGLGEYISSTIVNHSKKYTCKISFVEYDTIICEETLPAPTPIEKLEHISIAGKNEEGTSYPAIKITFPNDNLKLSYFEIVIKNEISFDTIKEIQQASIHTITDPVILNEGLPIALFSNEIIQDSIYCMTLNYTTGATGSSNGDPWRTTLYPFILELRTVSENYYRFTKQFYLYNKGISADGLLNNISAFPMYSNIENAHGIFAGYSIYKSQLITPDDYEN